MDYSWIYIDVWRTMLRRQDIGEVAMSWELRVRGKGKFFWLSNGIYHGKQKRVIDSCPWLDGGYASVSCKFDTCNGIDSQDIIVYYIYIPHTIYTDYQHTTSKHRYPILRRDLLNSYFDSHIYSPNARKTSSRELCDTRNWFTIASAASSEYKVVKIVWMFTSLGKLIWTVFACFVTIFASLLMFVWTNSSSEFTVSSLSHAKFN